MAKLADFGLSMTNIRENQAAEVPPRGRYHLRVERYAEGKASDDSKTPGALQYKVGLKVINPEAYENKWIWDTMTLAGERAEDNLGRLLALFLACGIPEDEIRDDEADFGTDAWAQRVIGCEVMAEVYVTKPTEAFPKAGNGVESYHEYDFNAELNDDSESGYDAPASKGKGKVKTA
jgi:hypothetical protein